MADDQGRQLYDLVSACTKITNEIHLRTQKPGQEQPWLSMYVIAMASTQALEFIMPDILSVEIATKYFDRKLEILKQCLDEFPLVHKNEIN